MGKRVAILVIVGFVFGIFAVTGSRIGSVLQHPYRQEAGHRAEGIDPGFEKYQAGINPEKQFPYGSKLPPDRYISMLERYKAIPDETTKEPAYLKKGTRTVAGVTPWTSIGPQHVIDVNSPSLVYHGRIRAFHWYYNTSINDWQRYAGASSGGLWLGQPLFALFWTSLGDNLPTPTIGAFAIDPIDANTIVVGTGDWARGYYGMGVLRTTDRGGTWTTEYLEDQTHTHYIWPEYISSLFYTLGNSVLWCSSNRGVFKSTDGGSSWTLVPINASDPQHAVYNLKAVNPEYLYATLSGDGIYWTNNGGSSWTKFTNGLPSSNIGPTIALDIGYDRATMYAAYGDTISNQRGIFKTTDGGAHWGPAGTQPAYMVNGQGFHANVISVNPNDVNTVYAGSVALIKSTDGGASWHYINGGHADFTVIDFDPTNPNTMVLCNDGGIFWRDDAADTVSNAQNFFLPGAPIQEYGMDVAESESGELVSGTQDNGTIMTKTAWDPQGFWPQISGCDGANNVSIDPLNADHFYYNSWCGTTWPRLRSLDGGSTIDNISTLKEIWYSPIQYAKGGGGVLLTVTDAAMYYSYANGSAWSRATTYPNDFNGAIPRELALARNAPLQNKTAYVLLGDDTSTAIDEASKLYSADGAPALMTWRTSTLPGGEEISAVIPDRWSPDRLFAWSKYGFYLSNDRGRSWRNINNNFIVGYSINDVTTSPSDTNVFYVGTLYGVFKTIDGGHSYYKFQTGLPIVSVSNLAYITGPVYDTIRIGTFGRGYWQRVITDVEPNPRDLVSSIHLTHSISASGKLALAVGDSGQIRNSTDGGSTWTPGTSPLPGNLLRCAILDSIHSIIAGEAGLLLRTTDGGAHWNPLAGVIGGSNVNDMKFSGSQTGWLVTDGGTVFRTIDGGLDWSLRGSFSPEQIEACAFTDDQHGLVAGSNNPAFGPGPVIHQTTDGGAHWSTLRPPGPVIRLLRFISPGRVLAAGDSGVVLLSPDGGTSWNRINTGAPGTLLDCTFPDTLEGWICGDQGALLRTEDGGNSWSQFGDWGSGTLAALSDNGSSLLIGGSQSVMSLSESHTAQIVYSLSQSWNMVSLPVQVPDSTPAAVFPGAISKLFDYAGGYHASGVVSIGTGYWIKVPVDTVSHVSGTPPVSMSIPLKTGWNLIGSFASSQPVSGLSTSPAGILASNFFDYNGRYTIASSLIPGKGYWIQASQDGVLMSSGSGSSGLPKATSFSGYTSLTIRDAVGNRQNLYCGEFPRGNFMLPPLPPAGGFDVRYADGSFVALPADAGENIIQVTGAQYPLTISWTPGVEKSAAVLLADGKAYSLAAAGSVILSGPGKMSVSVRAGAAVPAEFALHQNYPNPFNPVTTIRYDVSSQSRVILRIYNTLGQVVSTLVDGIQEAGYRTVVWDASTFASGVYFYRMEAEPLDPRSGNFTDTRKLLLIR